MKLSPKLKEKLELMTIGYGFLGLHYYALTNQHNLFSIGFAIVAGAFFIRALRVRP